MFEKKAGAVDKENSDNGSTWGNKGWHKVVRGIKRKRKRGIQKKVCYIKYMTSFNSGFTFQTCKT